MRMISAALIALTPFAAFAAGGGDPEPPKPTETSTVCTDGQVYSEETKACVDPEEQTLNNDQRYDAVRELAHAGRAEDAMRVLASMTEGDTDRVLTYVGFLNRQMGNWEVSLAAYDRAIAINPDNVLARSYYGQALVLMNETALASAQLDEIRARGGAGTWAEYALADAIATGTTTTY
jgi:tetratricopeptide (TPR) repeat protein